ncbi:PPE domain-containing protein [Nocardia sp. R16R-3T]
MIEPPQPGFTGVVWDAREPDRLARELSTGPGATPLAEAGAAWTRLAAGFGSAVAEYELIVGSLRGAWQSNTSGPVLDRISQLRDWLADAATAASGNAIRAETQSAAYELARLTMPHTAEIQAIQAVQRMLESIGGGALGAPLEAVAAATDTDADMAKAAAARVMRTYEAATEPLATPWIQQEPPVIASAGALAAEEESAPVPAATSAMPALPAIAPGMFVPGGIGAVPTATKLQPYRAPVYTEAPTPVEVTTPQPVPTSTASSSALPMVPGAMTAGGAEEEEYGPRAGAVTGDAIGADLGIAAAPAVLGAPEAPTATGRTALGGAE